MDLTQLANLGEFIGGVAVLVTLGYLAVQVRHSNKLAAADSMRSFLTEYNATVREINQPELMLSVRRGFEDFDGLGNDEKSRIHAAILTHIMLAQTAYVLDKRGVGDPDLMDLALGLNSLVVNTQGLQSWWVCAKGALNQDFVAYFDRERAKRPSALEVFPFLALEHED